MPEGVTMATILADITTLLTSILDWVGDVWNFIVGNPVLMIFVIGIPLISLAVGLLKRFFTVG